MVDASFNCFEHFVVLQNALKRYAVEIKQFSSIRNTI